jgi:predicted NBD/HSP70 family sugar kinase
MGALLGIDLGGTKIEAAILNRNDLTVIDRQRIDTESHKGYEHIVNQIALLINQISIKNNIAFQKVGIATPGTLDPITGVMKNCNTTSLNGMPLHKDLVAKLNMEVTLSNDANCFAIAEYSLGIVPERIPEAKVMFGVIMGTGVGGGLVVEGKVIGGKQGIGGEWGHNHLDDTGGNCYCGKVGCVEKIISGPSIENYYESLTGKRKKLKDIVIEYREEGSLAAKESIERLIDMYGKSISVIINIIDPDVIVLGGGVGNIDELYTLGYEAIKKYVFNNRLDTLILKPKLGDSAGVFGAALL